MRCWTGEATLPVYDCEWESGDARACSWIKENLRGLLAAQANSKAKYEGEKAEKDGEEDEEESAAATAKVGTMGREESVEALSESRSKRLTWDRSWYLFRRC